MSKNNNVGSLSHSTTVVARFLSLCAVLLAIPAIAAAQFLPPGWYRNNSDPSTFYKGEHLTITWENSYIYPYPAGVPLYWYAQVIYRVIGSQPYTISCPTNPDPSIAKEHIRGVEGIPPNGDGFVPAEDSFCTRNPGWTNTYMPGETLEDWVIFHNVPGAAQGEKGEISLEWGTPYGSSAWVEPWHTPFSAAQPAVCPHELETLGICQPGSAFTHCPDAAFIFPVNSVDTSGKNSFIGWLYKEPSTDPSVLHSGLDLFVAKDTPVMAVASGYVSRPVGFSTIENSYNVNIYYPSLGVETYTNNLLNLQVKQGSPVGAGTVIGYAGSYGDHIHWSVGSQGYNDQNPDWSTTTPHLDPTPYLTPKGNLNYETGAREDRSAPLSSWCTSK